VRILVTGGAGYIGSSVVYRLLRNGHQVKVADSLTNGGQSLMMACGNSNFELLANDISSRDVAAEAVKRCDVIIHLAAIVGTPACERTPEMASAINVGATETLLTVRKREQRFVFASTDSVYGAVSAGHCDESTYPEPKTLYGQTKLEAERLVQETDNGVIMRLTTAFGVSRALRWDPLVNNLTRQAVAKGKIAVYQPHSRRSFIHVDDASRALYMAALTWRDVRKGIINVGDDDLSVTKDQLARMICRESGAELTFDSAGEDPDRRDYSMSFDKIRALGFRANQSLAMGIKELVRAAKLLERRSFVNSNNGD
jgi:nucleoside-diphosphate-sugar epimerase